MEVCPGGSEAERERERNRGEKREGKGLKPPFVYNDHCAPRLLGRFFVFIHLSGGSCFGEKRSTIGRFSRFIGRIVRVGVKGQVHLRRGMVARACTFLLLGARMEGGQLSATAPLKGNNENSSCFIWTFGGVPFSNCLVFSSLRFPYVPSARSFRGGFPYLCVGVGL